MFPVSVKLCSAQNTASRLLHKSKSILSVSTGSHPLSFHEFAVLASHLVSFSSPTEWVKSGSPSQILDHIRYQTRPEGSGYDLVKQSLEQLTMTCLGFHHEA
jgi:hypothetical protein